MSQTRPSSKEHKAKYLGNNRVEWLMEYGKIREAVYFKGAIGDRYTIYVATKRNKNMLDFHTIHNSYEYGTCDGTHIATLDKNYILRVINGGDRWYSGCGNTLKQLMRQGVRPKGDNYDIRWCRSSYFLRFRDKFRGNILMEVAPWEGMKIDLKTGILINKPSSASRKSYKKAKEEATRARTANYAANKNNKDALARYNKAGGSTKEARGRWVHDGSNKKWANAEDGVGTENINWDMIPIDDVFKHRNVTLRSNIMEHYGMDAILKTLEYEIVDEDTVDNRPYRLLDVVIPDLASGQARNQKGLYLEMLNPSTGESHFEGIANVGGWQGPKEATVKEALRWRDDDHAILRGNGISNEGIDSEYIVPTKLT